MKLKTATILVIVSLIINLIINLSRWAIFAFDLLSFSDVQWLFNGVTLIGILLSSVPLILFFLVLNAKQK